MNPKVNVPTKLTVNDFTSKSYKKEVKRIEKKSSKLDHLIVNNQPILEKYKIDLDTLKNELLELQNLSKFIA
jgi:flagellar assembly factor FliW